MNFIIQLQKFAAAFAAEFFVQPPPPK